MLLFQERKQILIFAAAVAIVGGFVLLRYLPLRKARDAIASRRAAAESIIRKARGQQKQIPALAKQLADLQKKVENFEENVPSHRGLGVFLQQIAGLMSKHNLGNQLIEPGKETETGELRCIPVNIRCRGRLSQIFEFYKSLRDLERAIRIGQVELTNQSDFSGEVGMETKATIYYRAEAERG